MSLAQLGKDVTVVGRNKVMAGDCTFMHYRSMFQAAWERTPNLTIVTGKEAREIGEGYVLYADKESGETERVEADTVILAVGMRAKTDEALSYYGSAPHFYMLGDCTKPGTIQTTTRSAYAVCASI
jgi:pyruvate/2-oxoglutarate dehydrogenase complex dihydrolipoamide dehydrogenase (E3) component